MKYEYSDSDPAWYPNADQMWGETDGTPPGAPSNLPGALYHMDEGGGGTIHDASGHNNIGTIDGATYTANSRHGAQALSFDGVNDKVMLPSSTVNGLNDFTFMCWIKTTDNSYGILQGKKGSDVTAFSIYYSGTTLTMCIGSGGHGKTLSGLNNGVWRHFAYTRSGGTLTLYIDGERSAGWGGTSGAVSVDSDQLWLGTAWYGNYPLNGSLDE
ncbi:MAG: LamG domain-containing protein, partial [Candidatus Peribacteraceae bacterium]|nr:LamG domain-containing protein [Candidatus Peribacteraceae bacterium]